LASQYKKQESLFVYREQTACFMGLEADYKWSALDGRVFVSSPWGPEAFE